ncbi:hypothetical protein M9H77_02028 [Catharanthus roseus]|uniref:Uncharacterized protein n=1 Tax=Catharanthus roseus TaxID=4058 RepID=A0ACC0C7N2_CATRO|nr:hypothetical protein M9H77_02028 [Catharanthus roseus]
MTHLTNCNDHHLMGYGFFLIFSWDVCTDGKKKDKKKKNKKKVHFAEDVVDPIGNSDEYRKQRCTNNYNKNAAANSSSSSRQSSDESEVIITTTKNDGGGKSQRHQMPANRVALYNGILRDRVHHRVAYSY